MPPSSPLSSEEGKLRGTRRVTLFNNSLERLSCEFASKAILRFGVENGSVTKYFETLEFEHGLEVLDCIPYFRGA